ncbi:hypothetical protein Q4K74_001720 [Vibrio cholerae]|nr:hypothetical protein [Vibrio cholerae]EJL6905712.1 hypothetical protein [Vibrio cholerae]ELL0575683.1 hypothetical protein [Vibrio cholerae]ELT7225188.1 hypothetical protein [Vibrio cholerae]
MTYYNFITLLSVLYCGSSFGNELYFSCDTKNGTIFLEESQGILSYILVKDKKNEIIFESKGDGFLGFKYNHYSRFQTDYFTVSFINLEDSYTIFSNYESNQEKRGISVTNIKNKKESNYECETVHIDRLSDLSTKLTCDTDDALGCD